MAEESLAEQAGDRIGLSVVVPTYQGAGHIRACLESLAFQTLPPEDFEVLIVLNGPPDGTREVVDLVRAAHPDLDLRLLQVRRAGVSHARNVGLEAVRGAYVTFVDDDDVVGPDFLRAMNDAKGPQTIVAAPVHEVFGSTGHRREQGYIARSLERVAASTLRLSEVPVVCEYNAAKLISVEAARAARYDESLRSGEDLVYWLSICAAGDFEVRVLSDDARVAYVRTIRDGGIGRQQPSFDFRVTQRVECLAALQRIHRADAQVRRVAAILSRAQAQWINDYLRDHPEEHGRVVEEVRRHGVEEIPWSVVNAGLARKLALLYCFPPDLDTSGVVAAKRLREAEEITDVVSADLSSVRSSDRRALRLAGPALGRHHVVRGRGSFDNWAPVRRYVEQAWTRMERWEADPSHGGYERLYSRAMAVGAHIAAAYVKARRPELSWTAEFSDPLRYNTLAQERVGEIGDDEVGREVLEVLAAAGFDVPEGRLLFDVAERLAYALADRLVFTNEHQRDYMLGYCDDPALAARARSRSEVSAHPVPPQELYEIGRPGLVLEDEVVHLAYFGVFYATRDLSVLLEALRRLDGHERRRVALHVFTPQPRQLMVQAIRLGLADVVRPHPYVGYFDFLALTRRFDVLVVNDAETRSHHRVNPYLPSKVADYRGSGTPIWAVYEPGSVLSGLSVAHRSALGDVTAAALVVRELLAGLRQIPMNLSEKSLSGVILP